MGIETRFKKVFLEIENLEKKIQNREWTLLFEDKKYTFDNLMQSSNYQKIYNFTREVGDDISQLCTQGKMSDQDEKDYHRQRHHVDYELHRVHLLIEELDRLFWKSSKDIFEEFQDKIMLNLPKDPQKTFWKNLKKLFARLFGKKPKYLKEK